MMAAAAVAVVEAVKVLTRVAGVGCRKSGACVCSATSCLRRGLSLFVGWAKGGRVRGLVLVLTPLWRVVSAQR